MMEEKLDTVNIALKLEIDKGLTDAKVVFTTENDILRKDHETLVKV